MKNDKLVEGLKTLLNGQSRENISDTSDYILAEYMLSCLEAYENAVMKRDKWFGVDMWAPDKIRKK